jgi:hypothetical protein
MNSWHSYPKVWQLGHPNIKELFDDEVIIQEKVDGSQVSFGRFDGELKIRSKNKEIDLTGSIEKMFSKAVEVIKTLDLKDGWTYRGEYLQKSKHNTLAYERIPKNNIIIFDINTDTENYMKYDDVLIEADRIGLETVPCFSISKIDSIDKVKGLLECNSILGGTKIEGIVFKNYKKFGRDKKVLMGKYVSEAFKEIHGKEWKRNNPGTGDIISDIGKELKTDARYEKAIQHLKESGNLTNTPKDIGLLIKEIREDIKNEASEYIKDKLYKYAIDKILRISTGGFPEWYKNRLAENQFEEETKE